LCQPAAPRPVTSASSGLSLWKLHIKLTEKKKNQKQNKTKTLHQIKPPYNLLLETEENHPM